MASLVQMPIYAYDVYNAALQTARLGANYLTWQRPTMRRWNERAHGHYMDTWRTRRPFRTGLPRPKGYHKGIGKYSKSFNKARLREQTKYPVVVKTEYTNTVTDADTAYIGHGMAVFQVLEITTKTIIHALFRKSSIYIQNWNDTTQGDFRISLFYSVPQSTTDTTTQEAAFDFIFSQTFNDIATNIDAWILGRYSVFTTNAEELNYQYIVLFSKDIAPGPLDTWREKTTLFLRDSIITMGWTSNFKVQNTTTGAAAEDDQADDVTANPLRGRSYFGVNNGPEMKRTYGATALPDIDITARPNTGIIQWDKTNWSSRQLALVKRPFNKDAFSGVKTIGNAFLSPGQIKSDNLRFMKTYKINTVFRILQPLLKTYNSGTSTITNSIPLRLGTYKLFGFEKMVATGSNVTMAYENDQTYRGRFKEVRPRTDDLQRVL